MNVIDRDREILQSIDPQKLRDYLQSHGWHEDRPFLENATIWLKQEGDGGEFEILLPNRQDLGDYVPRIREAIATLTEVENRSQLEILSALTPIPNLSLEGVIMQISDSNAQASSVEIILLCAIADKLQKVYANFSLTNFSFSLIAMPAQNGPVPVCCIGDLIRKNDKFILKNIREFSVNKELLNEIRKENIRGNPAILQKIQESLEDRTK